MILFVITRRPTTICFQISIFYFIDVLQCVKQKASYMYCFQWKSRFDNLRLNSTALNGALHYARKETVLCNKCKALVSTTTCLKSRCHTTYGEPEFPATPNS